MYILYLSLYSFAEKISNRERRDPVVSGSMAPKASVLPLKKRKTLFSFKGCSVAPPVNKIQKQKYLGAFLIDLTYRQNTSHL